MEFKIQSTAVPIPAEFIKTHMLRANGSYVKVYLYLMYLASASLSAEQRDIAETLNLLESDVKNAIDYWRSEGLLSIKSGIVTMSSAEPNTAAPTAAPAASVTGETQKSGKKSPAQIAKIMSESEDLSGLCYIAQSLLGAPINDRDMQTLYWMYDELGMSVDVITMILEYCAEKDKRSVPYAEKVAITWHEKGIDTIQKAEELMKKEKERESFASSLRRLFGIQDRPLSKKEGEYLKKWFDELKMGEDMIALAYEYCVIQTSKLSFPYMDTILENWNKKGIHDIAAAQAEHEGYKSSKPQNLYKAQVDHSELESLMHDKFD